jgi:DNA-binding winged helix-turn-helix (wHTH) protein/TolB-like protein/Tfp pilus assembly protein PilF
MFGSFELDQRRGLVLRDGSPVQLRRKCFEALCVLAQTPGSVVSREDLTRKLWGDAVVGEDSLHKCIGELRRALEDKDQTTIQTIPGRGYMLVTGSEAAPVNPASPTLRMRPGNYVIAASVAGALALAIGGWSWYRMRQATEIRSVAVLPFASPTGDARTAAIAEGLAESVAASLSRSGGIRVASFEASWRLSRANPDPQRTGRDLSVDAMVVGRVRAGGDRLTVAVELVRVADQTQLWGRDFSARTAQLPELHFQIADHLLMQMGGGRKEANAGRKQSGRGNADAYIQWLRGRFERRKRTPEGNRAALDALRKAVELDSALATAWADLSEVELAAANFAAAPTAEARRLAGEAATKALQLDDSLGQAHATLAAVRWMEDFDWDAAIDQFRQALKLAPGSGAIYLQYSTMLLAMGKIPEALEIVSRGQDADPLSGVLYSWKANVLFVAGSYPEAIQESRKALATDMPLAHLTLGRSLAQLGQYGEALRELETAREKLQGDWRVLGDLAYLYAIAGQPDQARRLTDDIARRRNRGYFPALPIALGYTALRDANSAFTFLNQAVEDRSPELWLKADPRFHALRPDPRYSTLLAKMRLAGGAR